MRASISPFWTGLVLAAREREQRIGAASVILGLLALALIGGRVLAAWIGGVL